MKKNQIIIYVCALMLVTAGYWSYISKEAKTVEVVSMNENQTVNETTSKDENIGDATLVSSNVYNNTTNTNKDNNTVIEGETKETNATQKDDYFEKSRLERNTMYSKNLETYQNMINNSNISEEQKAIITQEVTKLNAEKNAIMICENLITAKGFDDVVIFVNLDSISVIVDADELSQTQIAQIQNIISREMKSDIENIHIMTK